MITSDSQQFTLHLSASQTVRERQTQGQTYCHLPRKYCLFTYQGCASLFTLECQQTFKYEYVAPILSCLVFEARVFLFLSVLRGFMLLLCKSTWGNNVSKNTSFLYSRNWKNIRREAAQRDHKNQARFFLVSLRFPASSSVCARTHAVKYAPLQEGLHWLIKAVSQV